MIRADVALMVGGCDGGACSKSIDPAAERGGQRRCAARMSHLEEAILRRFSGAKIFVASLALGLVCYLPLQLYIWFGPKDGNPIGLGLLAVAGLPISALGMVIGLIVLLVQQFARRGG